MSKNNIDNLIKKHDELSKKFLTDINMAREFLEIHLDKSVVAKCDLNTLTVESGSYIEDDLQKYFSDIVYKVDLLDKINCAYIYMLIEHQSKAETLMPLRILRYQLSILQKHIDEHKIDGNLPSVVPLVFYNGLKSPYPYATDIRDLFADVDIIDKMPLGTFGLVDLTVMSNDEILKHGKLALLEMVLKHIHVRDFRKVAELIYNAVFIAYRDDIQKGLFDSAVAYLMKAREAQELQPLFEQIITNIDNYKGDVMSYEETLIQKGRQEGVQIAQNMVKELLRSGVDDAIIAKASLLTQKELDEIKKCLN
jgi:predicted transposase/invertase (TIGR01784 family)